VIPNPYPGKFILLAGVDFSGKDTQASRIEKVLKVQYPNVDVLKPFPKEPTKTPSGQRIYDILFGCDLEFKLGVNLTDFEFQKFYIRNRIEHFKDILIPTLQSGVNVICNRGIDSTLAYGARTLSDFKRIMDMHEEMFVEAGLPLIWPDLIVVYDITIETMVKRRAQSSRMPDAFEVDKKAIQVISNYRALAALYPNCVLIDAEPDGEEGQKAIFTEARKNIFPVLGIPAK